MLVVDSMRAAGATPRSLIVGMGSLGRMGMKPVISSLGDVGLVKVSSVFSPAFPVVSNDGGAVAGNLNSESTSEAD